MRTLFAFAVLLVSLSPAITLATTPMTGLYQVQVPVTTQNRSDLNAAFNLALNGVLIKLTGAAEKINHPDTQRQIGRANRYVQSYQYVPQALGNDWLLSVNFDQQALNNLIETLGLSHWSTERPNVLTWVQINPDGIRWIITPEDRPQEAKLLRTQADTFGIPALFPIMDLDDRRAFNFTTVAEVTANDVSVLMDRYGVEAFLLGNVTSQTVLINAKTGAVLSTDPTAAANESAIAQPTAPPAPAATQTLAQQAQVRRVDPAMAKIADAETATNAVNPNVQSKQANYWVGEWQLFLPQAGGKSLQWQTAPQPNLSRAFAATFAQTAQYLAQSQSSNAQRPNTMQPTTPPPTQTVPAVINAPEMNPSPGGNSQQVRIVVSDINDLATYMAVKAYLTQLSIVQSVSLHRMSPGEVSYNLTITGDEYALQTAIGSGGTLIGENIMPGINLYRYQQQ